MKAQQMTKPFTTATATAAVLLAQAATATADPMQHAQVNVAPKIQPAPPPNLARPPAITPKIDMSRLAAEKAENDENKESAANPERVPQETTATGGRAPEVARWSAPPPEAARLTRPPLPQAKPDPFAGVDPSGLSDASQARDTAAAKEAAEAAAAAGVAVEHSDLGGLGDPMAGDQGGVPRGRASAA